LTDFVKQNGAPITATISEVKGGHLIENGDDRYANGCLAIPDYLVR
jgi:hypothetical protein